MLGDEREESGQGSSEHLFAGLRLRGRSGEDALAHRVGGAGVGGHQEFFAVGEGLVEVALGQPRFDADFLHGRRPVPGGAEHFDGGIEQPGSTLLLPLLAIGPDYLIGLFPQSWRDNAAVAIQISYFPAVLLLLILLVATLYKVAPKHRHPFKRGLPGAVLAGVLFIILSIGLRLYLSYVYAHGLTYGALATPITFLLFYYFASMAIIIGAQFNNALLEYHPPRRVTGRRTTDDEAPAGGSPDDPTPDDEAAQDAQAEPHEAESAINETDDATRVGGSGEQRG